MSSSCRNRTILPLRPRYNTNRYFTIKTGFYGKTRIPRGLAILLYSALLCCPASSVRASDDVTLKDGTTLEIIDIKSGTTQEFDSRSVFDKLKNRLPATLKSMMPASSNNGMISITGNDALGIATMYPGISPTFEDTYAAVASDESGWYSNTDSMALANNMVAYLYSMAPRSSKAIRLTFYDRGSTPAKQKKMGSINLSNPRFDEHFSSLPSSPVPTRIGTGAFKFDEVKMYTGVKLEDMEPRLPHLSFKYTYPAGPTTSVLNLFNNKVVAATSPETPWTALVFHITETPIPANRIQNMSISVTDSKGSKYMRRDCFLQGESLCAVAFSKYLPVHDGNYTFELTIYEAPPLDSSTWKPMPPLVPGLKDPSSTKTLAFGKGEISAGMTRNADTIDFSSTENLSDIALSITIDGTSQTLTIPPQVKTIWQKPYWCEAPLPKPVTSGTVTLSFAETIQHKITFTGTPEQVK